MKLVRFTDEDRYVKDFLKLPKMLYGSSNNTEDPSSMKSILLSTHPLSKYFSLDRFLVYSDNGKITGRFCITSYEGDDTAYFGFFECVNNSEAAKFLFDSAYSFCRDKGYKCIIGPVDASFWIKYRLKINKFEDPYTGEPYNLEYYRALFEDNGYKMCEHYTSNVFHSVDETYVNQKFEGRYNEFIANGYEIRSPGPEEFETAIGEVYDLISVLYSHFPVFKGLSKEDFTEVFRSYRSIVDFSMTKMAYYGGKAVGFYITVPDFGNAVYHINNPFNIAKILYTKKKPSRFVMLYMGVDADHRGLGKAISYAVMKELRENGCQSISALIRDGNVNQKYVTEDITDIYEYALFKKDIR